MSLDLTFDIQVEIIKRLPVKSLIQFRWVCKAWKSFIESSEFIAAYNIRHHESDHLLVRYAVEDEEEEVKYVCFVDDDTFPQRKFSPTVPALVQGTYYIIGSSDGLFCLLGDCGGPGDGPYGKDSSDGLFCLSGWGDRPYGKEMAVLWNPAIGKSIGVVVPYNNSIIGFGVCPVTKDPKIVNITDIIDPSNTEGLIPCQVMVFTLSSGEWRCLSSNQLPRRSISINKNSQTVIGQFIHWVARELIVDSGYRYTKADLIVSYDLSNDEFREVDLPDCLHRCNLAISRCGESLVLLRYEGNLTPPAGGQVCSVWMMMDRGDSKEFTKLFTIDVPNASVELTLGFRKSGEPIIEMLRDETVDLTTELAVYEPCLEEIMDLGIRGNRYSFHASSYTESLLLLDHDDGRIIRC